VPATTGLPVFQWEIDPLDPTLEAHEVSLDLDGWEFSIWWQVHPAELLYVSIQALRDDRADGNRGERGHPIGRNVVANLVFDRRRGGVVAVYGTTHDFRPFIEAFKRAYDAKQTEQNR
jgi:hypothetical protein